MKIRREVEGISLSFLDVISCGFGAVLLMLVLVRTFSTIDYDPSDLEAELDTLIRENQALEKKIIETDKIQKEIEKNQSEKQIRLKFLQDNEKALSLIRAESKILEEQI